MRELSTIQKVEKLNRVFAIDEKGKGNANHVYIVDCALPEPHLKKGVVHRIQFQNGPRKDLDSTHGVLDVDLLEIVRDRLISFQEGEFATDENKQALEHIESALICLNRRIGR